MYPLQCPENPGYAVVRIVAAEHGVEVIAFQNYGSTQSRTDRVFSVAGGKRNTTQVRAHQYRKEDQTAPSQGAVDRVR